ncbi:MAG: RlmE family RNA methyltransferase [Thermodesulfobacteriota bacterium]|nr:RlmE family RNA methyltransferase [Thermodesulfobacteriota bacterium]
MKKKSMKQGKKNQWADHWTNKAKADKYPARSVYKLMEIQKKFKVIKKNDSILDLGCAPGSWLMYAAETAGLGGRATGIDLKKVDVKLPGNAKALTGDIFEMNDDFAAVVGKDYNVVLSDMAPATTGRKETDAARSFELCQAALKSACSLLAPGGNFVCKIFQGSDFKEFELTVKSNFREHKIFKPDSCRKSSKEIYIIGIGKK